MGEDRITKLEIRFAEMAVDMKHVVAVVEELKSLMIAMTKLEVVLARQDERWENHLRIHEQVATVDDLARIADRVVANKAQANGTNAMLKRTDEQVVLTKISVAKFLASGAGGGAVIVGLIELIKFLAT